MIGFCLWVYWCASLLVDAGEWLGYVCYDIIECLLKTSSLGLCFIYLLTETGLFRLYIINSFYNPCILAVIKLYLIYTDLILKYNFIYK